MVKQLVGWMNRFVAPCIIYIFVGLNTIFQVNRIFIVVYFISERIELKFNSRFNGWLMEWHYNYDTWETVEASYNVVQCICCLLKALNLLIKSFNVLLHQSIRLDNGYRLRKMASDCAQVLCIKILLTPDLLI